MSMKVLIANKFYYNRGGDCIMSIGLEKLLLERNHEVAFFSMQYPDNYASKWQSYFPSQVDFHAGGLKNIFNAAIRIFHSSEVEKQFTSLLNEFKPDIVHLNNVHSQISPIIGEIAHRKGIKVIWTLHDYKLVCPTYTCLRQGQLCELCFQRPWSVLTKQCMKNSLFASLLAYLESLYWNKTRLEHMTDMFIAPSQFIKNTMIRAGFSEEKIQVLPNFTNRVFPKSCVTNRKEYYCFVGRLSPEKGVKTLIEAARKLPYELIIIGDGPLRKELFCNDSRIRFVGFKEWKDIATYVSEAKFLVVPSEWYEVFGLTNIESLSLGTPVLGAHIGGIPELINETNGMLFEAGNVEDLREKIGQMFTRTFNYTDICKMAREQYSAANYYTKLIEIYEQ